MVRLNNYKYRVVHQIVSSVGLNELYWIFAISSIRISEMENSDILKFLSELPSTLLDVEGWREPVLSHQIPSPPASLNPDESFVTSGNAPPYHAPSTNLQSLQAIESDIPTDLDLSDLYSPAEPTYTTLHNVTQYAEYEAQSLHFYSGLGIPGPVLEPTTTGEQTGPNSGGMF